MSFKRNWNVQNNRDISLATTTTTQNHPALNRQKAMKSGLSIHPKCFVAPIPKPNQPPMKKRATRSKNDRVSEAGFFEQHFRQQVILVTTIPTRRFGDRTFSDNGDANRTNCRQPPAVRVAAEVWGGVRRKPRQTERKHFVRPAFPTSCPSCHR